MVHAPNYHNLRVLEHAVMVKVDHLLHGTPDAGTRCGPSKIGGDPRGTYYCVSLVLTRKADVTANSKVQVAPNGRSWRFLRP
jgi:hypothetical protein